MNLRWVLILVAAVGCKKSREQECDDLAKLGTAFASELDKRLGNGGGKAGQDPEIKAAMAELKQQCMKWPDAVFECMRNNDETSPKCRDAMAQVNGRVATDATKAPDGPPIVATADLGEWDWEGLVTSLAPDGTLTATAPSWVAEYAPTGQQTWRAEIETKRWMVMLGDGSVLVTDRAQHDLVALDGATGQVRWRAAWPKTDEYDSGSAEGAVAVGNRVYVAIDDGRVMRLDPAACTKKPAACMELAFTLADESFSEPTLFAVGDDLGVGESGIIRLFKVDGTLRASIALRDSSADIASLGGTKIAAVMDEELVLWDLAKCGSNKVVLPRKKGRMYIRGEGDCEDCTTPPEGCLVARSELSDVESVAPFALKDGSVAVQVMDGPARAAPNGNKHWVAEVDGIGPIREVGDALVFLSREDDAKPLRLVALASSTGKATWQRALPTISGDISYSSEPFLEVAGNWIVVGSKGKAAWLKTGAK